MSSAAQSLALSTPLILGSAQTWNINSGRTLTISGSGLNAGANLLTIAGAGATTINNSAIISSTGGITKNSSSTFTINGGANQHSIGSSTLTVNGGIVNLSNPATVGITDMLANSAKLTLGGGSLTYTYAVNLSQSFASLTINPGENALFANRNGSFNTSLTTVGTVTRNIGGTVNCRPLDTSRGATTFSGLTASAIVKDANGTPYMTIGNPYSGTTLDNFQDWGALDSSRRVVAATYTANTATSVGTSTQNGNVTTAIDTTLAANATSTCFRDGLNENRFVDLNGKTWQTGGILVNSTKATAGSTIKDTAGTGSLTGPANSDLLIMISSNAVTSVPYTISAKIVNNTSTAITKGAPGTLILSGNNTFTGGVNINDGVIQIGNVGALNSTTPNAINFNGSGMISGIANTVGGANGGTLASLPTMALAGNSISVASLSTANIQTGVLPIVENANGSSVANSILTINGSSTTTFAGTMQDGAGGGTLSLVKNGAGTQTIGGTLSYSGSTTIGGGTLALINTPSGTTGYTVTAGTLDVSALATLALSGSQLLSGSGAVNGTVSAAAGTKLLPGSGTANTGGSGILNITNLTVSASTVGNFGLNASDANNCQINVGTLTLPASGTMTLNLYSPGTSTAFAAAGTYNLFKYNSIVNGTSLASRFTINTSVAGFSPTFGTAAGPGGTTYLTLTLTPIVAGVDATWNTDFDGNWSDATKWSSNPNVPSAANDLATFGTGTALRTVTLDANESAGGVTMNNNNSFAIADAGKILTLDNSGNGANVIVQNGTANDIQTAVALNDTATLTVSSGKSLTVSGAIANTSGAKALTINGAGTTKFSAANSYGPSAGSVGTTLSGGILQVGNSAALGFGDVNVTASSTLQAVAAGLNLANNFTFGVLVNATVDNNANNLTLGGIISGSGALTKINAGVLTLSGANSYAGNTTISAGTVKLGASNVIPDGSGKGDVSIAGTLDLNGNSETINGLSGAGTVDNVTGGGASTLTVGGNNASGNFSGSIQNTTGTIGLNKTGSGSLTLSSANTYSGGTILSAGQLNINNAGSGGTSSAIGTGTLTISGGTIDNTSATDITLSPTVAQNWNGDFTYAGSLHNLNLGSGAVTMNATRSVTVSGNTLTVGGAISGSTFGLTKAGSGTLILTGNNSFNGATTVSGGTLQLDSGGVINGTTVSSTPAGTVVRVNGGSLTASGVATIGANAATASFLLVSGNATFNGGINAGNNDGQLISVAGGSFTASSVSISRNAINSTPPTLTAPIAASTLNGFYVNGAGATASLGTLTVGSSGGNSSATARVDAGIVTASGKVLIGNVTGGRWNILQVNGGSFTSSDTANGIVLSQNNTTSGNNSELYLSGGTTTVEKISFGASSDTVNNTGFLILSGGTLYLGGGGIVTGHSGDSINIGLMGGILGAKADWSSILPMTLGGGTIQAADAASAAHNITLSGALSGAAVLTKTGSGTLTLGASAGNSYSGGTLLNTGTLLVNNTTGSGTGTGNVTNSGTLGGSGIISGGVTNLAGATVQPGLGGTDTSTLTVNNNLTMISGTMQMALNRGNVQTASKLALTGGSSVLTKGGTLTVVNVGSPVQAGDSFTLFTAANQSGIFSTINLPALGTGTNWWTADNYATLLVNKLSATNATYTREKGTSLKIAISDLVTSFPAGGNPSLVVTTTANGATLSTNSTYIFYVPANDNNDSFSYTVNDVRGGTSTGTITINVTSQPGGSSGSISVSGGAATVGMFGIPGVAYDVQRSLDLNSWTTLTTSPPLGAAPPFTAASDGRVNFTDNFSDLGNAPGAAYYRLIQH